MTLKKRFLLVSCGVIAFLVLAPVIVLAARGYYFDFSQRRLVKTATLSIKTEPRGADVFVSGKPLGNTPLVKRFFLPGDYEIRVEKGGFQPWVKEVALYEERVTGLPRGNDRIVLLLAEPQLTSQTATSSMPLAPVSSKYFIDARTNLLKAKSESGETATVFAEPLPNSRKQTIAASRNGQIFVLLDDVLYQIGSELNKINDRVTYAAWNEDADALVYGNDYEIWFFRPLDKKGNELVTRVSGPIAPHPAYNPGAGYVFYSSESRIVALEYDPLGQPNQYMIAQTTAQHVPMSINDNGDELTYLDSGQLITLKIR